MELLESRASCGGAREDSTTKFSALQGEIVLPHSGSYMSQTDRWSEHDDYRRQMGREAKRYMMVGDVFGDPCKKGKRGKTKRE